MPTARIYRNSRKSFLLGASWSYHPSFGPRMTHIYLGPWVLTVTTRGTQATKEA